MNRLVKSQFIVFILSFLCNLTRHAVLESWIMAKPEVNQTLGFSSTWLGSFDMVFLMCYASGNFISGILGDSYPVVMVVSISMLSAGGVFLIVSSNQIILLALLNVTHPGAYIGFFGILGFFFSAVWPGTVAIMGTWFSKGSRGKILGIWSANTVVGNIVGSQIAAGLYSEGVSWEYVTVLMVSMLVFVAVAFWVSVDDKIDSALIATTGASSRDIQAIPERRRIPIRQACMIPGVIFYSLTYSGIKMMNYGLMMWLPYFLEKNIGVKGEKMGLMVGSYDLGGTIGTIILGWLSDKTKDRILVTTPVIVLTIPLLFCLKLGNSDTLWYFFILIPLLGACLGGLTCFISSVVAADLGQAKANANKEEAKATIAGIVDGSGGIGASVGQFIIGALQEYSWDAVFNFMISVCIFSILWTVPIMQSYYKRSKNEYEEEEGGDGKYVKQRTDIESNNNKII